MLDLAGTLLLVAVGGYGDAASFLLVHCFTGHVTGNTVLAAIALATRGGQAWEPVLAVCCFLGATALAQKLRSPADQAVGSSGFRFVLLLEIVLLSVSPFLVLAHHPRFLIAAMCVALGLQNGALSKAEGIGLHTTYLSGTLTRFVGSLVHPAGSAAALEIKFIPLAACAFVTGAVCGSLMILHSGPRALWVMPVLLLGVLVLSFPTRSPAGN